MAFKFLKDLTGSPLVATGEFLVTDSEAITKGQALYFASGRLTKAVNGGKVAAVALESKVAGTDVKVKVAFVTPTQVWRCSYTGTPDVGFVVGVALADVDSTGLLINAADITGGAFTVIAKDTAKATVDVMCNGRQLA